MVTLRQAAQQALEALEISAVTVDSFRVQKATQEAITALRNALEQPEQEPTCPECKAAVLYECVACSSNNYTSKPQQEPVASEYIGLPVAYQYAYPDGTWRFSFGDEIDGCKPIASRAVYARKDGK